MKFFLIFKDSEKDSLNERDRNDNYREDLYRNEEKYKKNDNNNKFLDFDRKNEGKNFAQTFN